MGDGRDGLAVDASEASELTVIHAPVTLRTWVVPTEAIPTAGRVVAGLSNAFYLTVGGELFCAGSCLPRGPRHIVLAGVAGVSSVGGHAALPGRSYYRLTGAGLRTLPGERRWVIDAPDFPRLTLSFDQTSYWDPAYRPPPLDRSLDQEPVLRAVIMANLAVLEEQRPTASLATANSPARVKHDLEPWAGELAARCKVVADVLTRVDDVRGLASLREAALNVLGFGPGLTPGGDDFLVGVLLGLGFLVALGRFPRATRLADWLGRQSLSAELDATSAISAAFIRDAIALQASEPVHRLLDGLLCPSPVGPREVQDRSKEIGRWGATSGALLLRGIAAGTRGGLESARIG